MPQEYVLRTTRDDPADHAGIADLLNAAFGRDSHHGAELSNFAAYAPSFRRELDLVATSSDGTIVAYAAVCWDEANHLAIFEPVCTHPTHRKRGLAAALMREGIRRAREAGAALIQVETGDSPPADALYESIGFSEEYRGRVWERQAGAGPA
jgi:predicted N-acetyltransferase YhbS